MAHRDSDSCGPAQAIGAAHPVPPADMRPMVADAVRERRVALAFQPVVRAAAPGSVAFHEGLIRLMDRSGRAIPARKFIAAVEKAETGRLIDCLALELGAAALRARPGLRLSINMSARSIGYPRWTETLETALGSDATLGERLILEITESSAMLMPEIVAAFMQRLHRHGLSFALDDFGAGFTSFRYLREFYFDIVKIDGQFVRGISRDTDNRVLVAALVSIASHFGMFTVAESVERAEDADMVASLGVDCMQGYHFGMPVLRPAWTTRGAAASA